MEGFTSNRSDLLQEGLAAAKAGDVARAKSHFLKAAEEDPATEMVWICLAAIEPQMQDRLRYLRRAAVVNPTSSTALSMIKAARKQLSQALVAQAIQDLECGKRENAQNVLLAAAELDPQNTVAPAKLLELDIVSRKQAPSMPVVPEPELPAHTVVGGFQSDLDLSSGLDLSLSFEPETSGAVERGSVEGGMVVELSLEDYPDSLPAIFVEPHETDTVDAVPDLNPVDVPPAELPIQPDPATPASSPVPVAAPACLFCLTVLTQGTEGRCNACGGLQAPFNPRNADSQMMGTIDQRAILGAVNRIAARLRANPEDSELHYALGLAYLNLGRLNTAVECLKRSQQLVPRPALEPDIAALSTPPCSTQVTAKPEVSDPGEIDGARGEGQVREQAAEPKVVLIAEDSATMRKLVAGALEKEGYTVVTAADGAEAVEKFHETPVDLVLLDVVMPNMDGYQVCRTLRAANKTLPIVLLSARDGLFDKFRGKVAGCSAYIAKPFLREDLVASVQQFCPLNNQQEILQS